MSKPEIVIEKEVEFTVPYLTPPSVNHYKRSCYYRGRDGNAHKGFKLTDEAVAFKSAVAVFAQGRTVAPATDRERSKVKYRVEITVVLGPKKRLDADNGGKVALDALQGCGVIHSDAFVTQNVINVVKNDRKNPHTQFVVTRMEPQ